MLRIMPADPGLVEVALNIKIDLPAVAYVGHDKGVYVGSGGLAWSGGKCWVWFRTTNPQPRYALRVVRFADVLKRKARQFGETEIYAIREIEFETSGRLMHLAGFHFVGFDDGHEVFRCFL